MGQSTNAIIAFGWNLGGIDGETPTWAEELMEQVNEANDLDDLINELLNVELPPNPFDEIRNKPNDWFHLPVQPGQFHRQPTPEYQAWMDETVLRRKEHAEAWQVARKSAPFELVSHCSIDYPMYILTLPDAHWVAYRGYPVLLDVQDLKVQEWTTRLLEVTDLLDLKPDTSPTLVLASDWG